MKKHRRTVQVVDHGRFLLVSGEFTPVHAEYRDEGIFEDVPAEFEIDDVRYSSAIYGTENIIDTFNEREFEHLSIVSAYTAQLQFEKEMHNEMTGCTEDWKQAGEQK